MKDNVKVWQLALLLIIPGGKLLFLPSILASEVGHDSWLVMAVLYAIDIVCLVFVVWSIKINKSKLPIDTILQNSIGTVGAKVVFLVLFVVLMSRIIVVSSSCYQLFNVTFSVKSNWIVFLVPLSFTSFFAVRQGFRVIARLNELFCIVTVVALVAIMIEPASQIDVDELLPICECGMEKLTNCCLENCTWFTDYLFLYFIIGNVKKEKHYFLPIVLCFVVGALLSVVSNAIFVALYGETAQIADLAISKISMFSVSTSVAGRWDWLSISVWVFSLFIRIFVYAFGAYKSVCLFCGVSGEKFNVFATVPLFVFGLAPILVSLEDIEKFFITYLYVPSIAVQYLLPFILPLLVKVANSKSLVRETVQ